MNKETKYIFNPSYLMKNDLKRIIITDKNPRFLNKNNIDVNTEFITAIHPIHAMMLSFFNGKDNLDTVISKISYFFGLPYEKVEKLVSIYIENKNEILLEYEGNIFDIPKNIIVQNTNNEYHNYRAEDFIIEEEVDIQTERLFLPLDLTFMMTNKCLTNCIYCYADRKTKYKPISFERLKIIIKEAKNIGIRNFDLSGGELFLYSNWEELLIELSQNGFFPYISTKIPIEWDTINKLKNLGFKTIQFSIDSLNPKILKETIKTKDDYIVKLKESLRNCEDLGIKIRINTVLTRQCYVIEDFKSLIEYLMTFNNLENHNITIAGYSIYLGEKEYLNYRLNENSIKEIQNFVNNINNDYPIEFNDYAKQVEYLTDDISLKNTNFQKRAKCTGNIENFYILPDGKVTICEELYWHENFIIGDLSKQTIEEVWNSEKALSLYNLSQEMIQESSACKTCGEYDECHKFPGVCWKLIIEAYGSNNWDYPDPRCPYAPIPKNTFFVE
ncbi:MAG: radical SAM protein [Marinilabiliales bacterium]